MLPRPAANPLLPRAQSLSRERILSSRLDDPRPEPTVVPTTTRTAAAFLAVAEAASMETDPAVRVEVVEATQPVAAVVLPAVEVVLKPPMHERVERQRSNFYPPTSGKRQLIGCFYNHDKITGESIRSYFWLFGVMEERDRVC